MADSFQIVIVGGGTAGISVAARLRNADPDLTIALIEPSKSHFYQPMWTLVGGGVFDKEESRRAEVDFIPDDVEWIIDSATEFDPEKNQVTLKSGNKVTYENLIVAPGIQIDWDKVKGLPEALGKNGVTSNYSYDVVDKTWDFLRSFKGGNAVFTYPATPIKCAGAPQKIMWLAEHHFCRTGVRNQTNITYGCATPGIFGVARYAEPLNRLIEKRNINTMFRHSLTEIRAKSKQAVFADMDGGSEKVVDYDFIHVTPPMSAPDFIKRSPLANEGGWVDVDQYTTQHNKYPNVFSLGDASSLPCSKTGAAIRKQAPVTVENIIAFRGGNTPTARYEGYASCPLVTGYGRLILAEFGYGGVAMETFPFDQRKERYSMWLMKTQGLPNLYWHGMLRGRV